ncbi:MAG: ROK family protein [Sedimentisphaerales bacterium]|nr:ROK family protein [Sedimentisphaerales bacterium]
MKDYFVGVDLGGTNVEVCLLSDSGEVVGRGAAPTEVALGPVSLVDRVAAICQEMLASSSIGVSEVRAFCIGSPGPISVSEGKIIKAGNLPGFDNFRLRGELSARLGVPGLLENDANVACWGEFWRGAGRGTTDMVMFTLGTGIGGGMVVAGELVHGSEDNGAELGHMIIVPKGRKCSCGQCGCLEAYASASHTAKRAMEALQAGRSSVLEGVLQRSGTITSKDVFECAVAGDELANEVVDGTAAALAQACVSMRHITEPQTVVLAGGMINAGDMLTSRVKKFYNEMMWNLKSETMEICLAQLGADAGVIGAAGLALHHYQNDRLGAVGE